MVWCAHNADDESCLLQEVAGTPLLWGKDIPSPHFKKRRGGGGLGGCGLRFEKLTQWPYGYKGWKAAWMHLSEHQLLHAASPAPSCPLGHSRTPTALRSLLHFTKVHNLQVCLLHHIVYWEQGPCLTHPAPFRCSTQSQARLAWYPIMNQTLCWVPLRRTL